ncbi:MAG: glycosyltransferase [Acidobacteriota bacterium]|nr:glycosyltransferase [Acidobacteriota bacterium]
MSRLKIRLWRPQILHAHFGTRGSECLTLKKMLRIPLLTSFYGYDAWRLPEIDRAWRKKYEKLFAAGDAFLVEGPAMRERLVQLGCPVQKILIHRIGVDLSTIPMHPYTHKRASSPIRVVMVGRFVEKKGFTDGLRACLQARLRGADIKITIVGSGVTGDHASCVIENELLTLAAEPRLSGRVEFTGFVPLDKATQIIDSHDVFLCPSRHAKDGDAEGGSPVVLTEAMALGLICVGTRHCDIPEVIIDGETGYLCSEGDVSGMANVLCHLATDFADAAEMGANGRKHIETHFSLKAQLPKLNQIYRSLVAMT